MKKKYFIFLLFLVVLCLLGIISLNNIKTYALIDVPTNSYIGEMEILPFYSEENEFINYGLAYNSYNKNNYFISTYINKNQGFSYPDNSYYFWLYNFDLINIGNFDGSIEEVQQFTLSLNSEIKATFDFVVGQTWLEWYITSLNTNNVVTYDDVNGAFYFDNDYIILNITPTNLILNQDYEISNISPISLKGATIQFNNDISFFSYPNDVEGSCLINDLEFNYFASAILEENVYGITFMGVSDTVQNIMVYVSDYYEVEGVDKGWYFSLDGSDNLVSLSSPYVISNFDFPDLNENADFISWVSENASIEYPLTSSSIIIERFDLSNSFTNEELISYFKTCINWDFSILQRVITGTSDLYLNYNGLWFKCNYNPYGTTDSEMYLNIVYNPILPTSTTDNYNYGLGEITPYVLNAYNNYELRSNIQEELKTQQSYYESLIEQEKNQAFQDGYNNGESYGYNTGYDGGYNVGYADGLAKGSDGEFSLRSLLGAIFSFPLQILTVGMDVEIFGINLGGLIMFMFALSIVIIIIRLILKFFGR